MDEPQLMGAGQLPDVSTGDVAARIDRFFADAVQCHRAGRLADAQKAYQNILALDARHAASWDGLGQIAYRKGDYTAAVDLIGKAIEIDPNVATFYLDLGNSLADLGRIDEAIASYQRAIVLKPDLVEAHSNLGKLYINQGRSDEACSAFETAIELLPERGELYRLRAFIKPLRSDSALFGRLEKLADSISALSETDQIELHFALGTAYADCGEYQRSFNHLLSGNALKRKSITYDEGKTLARIARFQKTFSREFLAARQDFGIASRLPIFVVGMPRSGSTLVEQILASHPDVFGAGEVQILPFVLGQSRSIRRTEFPEIVGALTASQVDRLGEEYLRLLRTRAPTAIRIVDKHLENFTSLGLIRMMLPDAKIIHIRRDPVDACLSSFSNLFNGNYLPYTYDLGELGRFYCAYSRLMDHWREIVPPEVMLEVPYEELVGDFDSQARRIIEHCGLVWDERCRTFYQTQRVVKTASALQVRQPIYRTSLGKWTAAYGDLARPLIDALAG